MTTTFSRGLDSDFIEKLGAEVGKGGWWDNVLADQSLLIAVRERYLDVYWHGQRLFHVTPGLKVTTHAKYLVDPKLADQVSLTNGEFDIAKLRDIGFVRQYEGPATLNSMKSAADYFSGLEKTGCHAIAINNPNVIDCEIAFPHSERIVNTPRVDLASLEAVGTDAARLVFWEAKRFSNGELRAAGDRRAPVCDQVEGYKTCLAANRTEVEKSYKRVAENLMTIDGMRPEPKLLPDTLIAEVSTGKRQLTLGDEPSVGLIIFGFDRGQRDELRWQSHLRRLTLAISKVLPRGDAKSIKLPR